MQKSPHIYSLSPTGESTPAPAPAIPQPSVEHALARGEVLVSVSELLGCDYVFIQHPAKTLLVHERQITGTLNQLTKALGILPRQKIFIGVHRDGNGERRFHRFECEWSGPLAVRVTRTPVVDDEQCEFAEMMFACSSPLQQDAS